MNLEAYARRLDSQGRYREPKKSDSMTQPPFDGRRVLVDRARSDR